MVRHGGECEISDIDSLLRSAMHDPQDPALASEQRTDM